jgi:hypothetical protein
LFHVVDGQVVESDDILGGGKLGSLIHTTKIIFLNVL